MTDDDKARAVERDRRKREDELLLLLLLLMDEEEQGAAELMLHGYDPAPAVYNRVDRVALAIMASMADMHADAFRRYGLITGAPVNRIDAGARSGIEQIYEGLARVTAQAMADAVAESLYATRAKFPDEEPKLLAHSAFKTAGYAKDNTTALRSGIERAIVGASNGGMITVAVRSGIALRHVSIIDNVTTAICRERNGLTLLAADSFWRWNCPPLHYNCRSVLVPMFGNYELSDRLPELPPAPGFGKAPDDFIGRIPFAA